MASQLDAHLLHQVEQIAQHLQHVHLLGSQLGLGSNQSLAELRHALAEPLDPFLQLSVILQVQGAEVLRWICHGHLGEQAIRAWLDWRWTQVSTSNSFQY